MYMNILIITENFFPFVEPTAKIVERLTKSESFKDSNFIIISKGNIKKTFSLSENIVNYQMESHYRFSKNVIRNLKTFFYKTLSVIYSFFFPRDLIDYRRYFKLGKKIISNNRIDFILAVSGWFSSQMAANLLFKKFNVPFYCWYTDPFLFNVGKSKYPLLKLKKIELKWLKNAELVFLPNNYLDYYNSMPNYFNQKFKRLELPCFFSSSELQIIQSSKQEKIMLHAGSFSSKFRDPKKLFEVAKVIELKSDFIFSCLGQLDRKLKKKYLNKIPNNTFFKDRVDSVNLLKEIGKASILILVDNYSGIQIPSKLFEYISTGKPILFFYSNTASESLKFLSKYPICLCIHDDENINDELIEKILNLANNVQSHFDTKDHELMIGKYENSYIFNLMHELIINDLDLIPKL